MDSEQYDQPEPTTPDKNNQSHRQDSPISPMADQDSSIKNIDKLSAEASNLVEERDMLNKRVIDLESEIKQMK